MPLKLIINKHFKGLENLIMLHEFMRYKNSALLKLRHNLGGGYKYFFKGQYSTNHS